MIVNKEKNPYYLVNHVNFHHKVSIIMYSPYSIPSL